MVEDEDTPVLRPQNVVFSDISSMAILAGDHPSESVKVRQLLSLAKR